MYRTDKQFMKNPATASSRIYVGNLAETVVPDNLEEKFAPYGRILGLVVQRGFGFIQFETEDQAQGAINNEHGTSFFGKKLNVKQAVDNARAKFNPVQQQQQQRTFPQQNQKSLPPNAPNIQPQQQNYQSNQQNHPQNQPNHQNNPQNHPSNPPNHPNNPQNHPNNLQNHPSNPQNHPNNPQTHLIHPVNQQNHPIHQNKQSNQPIHPNNQQNHPGHSNNQQNHPNNPQNHPIHPNNQQNHPNSQHNNNSKHNHSGQSNHPNNPQGMQNIQQSPNSNQPIQGNFGGNFQNNRNNTPNKHLNQGGNNSTMRPLQDFPASNNEPPRKPMNSQQPPFMQQSPGNPPNISTPIPPLMAKTQVPITPPMEFNANNTPNMENQPEKMDKRRRKNKRPQRDFFKRNDDPLGPNQHMDYRDNFDDSSNHQYPYYDQMGSNYGPEPGYHAPIEAPERNDCEIIVVAKSLTEFAEYIEKRLKDLGLIVDLLFPNDDVPIGRVLGNISSRGCLYAILVMPQNEEHRSLTLNILHGIPEEHRNMPIEDALVLITRNFDAYMRGETGSNTPSGNMTVSTKHPEHIQMILNLLAENRQIGSSCYDKIIKYLQEKRELQSGFEIAEGLDTGIEPETKTKQAELQNRIMSILNKKEEEVVIEKPAESSTKPILQDPTVQKALDSLLSGDMFKGLTS